MYVTKDIVKSHNVLVVGCHDGAKPMVQSQSKHGNGLCDQWILPWGCYIAVSHDSDQQSAGCCMVNKFYSHTKGGGAIV